MDDKYIKYKMKYLNLKKIQRGGGVFDKTNPDSMNNKADVLAAVTKNGSLLRYVSDTLKNDKEVVLAAVTNDGYALEFASETLRNDRDVVLVAVKKYGSLLRFASPTLKGDKGVVLAAVTNYGWALEIASQELQNDRDIVLPIVIKNGSLLRYVSHTLKGDKAVVLAAVTNYGLALAFASTELKNDRDVVLAALTKNTFRFASPELQMDPIILIMLLYNILQSYDVKLELYNKHYTMGIINSARLVIINKFIKEFKQEFIKNNENKTLHNVASKTSKVDSKTSKDASKTSKDDSENILARMGSDLLKNISGFLESSTLKDGFYMHDGKITPINEDIIITIDSYLKNDKNRALDVITKTSDINSHRELFNVYKDDKEIILAAVVKDGLTLRFASDSLKDNDEIVLAAVVNNRAAFQHASVRLKEDNDIRAAL